MHSQQPKTQSSSQFSFQAYLMLHTLPGHALTPSSFYYNDAGLISSFSFHPKKQETGGNRKQRTNPTNHGMAFPEIIDSCRRQNVQSGRMVGNRPFFSGKLRFVHESCQLVIFLDPRPCPAPSRGLQISAISLLFLLECLIAIFLKVFRSSSTFSNS